MLRKRSVFLEPRRYGWVICLKRQPPNLAMIKLWKVRLEETPNVAFMLHGAAEGVSESLKLFGIMSQFSATDAT